jgi:MFS transporter, ACS family, D-galactonate transporter
VQRRIGHLRWVIAILLGVGIVINYLDRVNISVATKPLEQSFHLSAGEMGIVLSSFLWSYALLQLPIGALLDKVGVK